MSHPLAHLVHAEAVVYQVLPERGPSVLGPDFYASVLGELAVGEGDLLLCIQALNRNSNPYSGTLNSPLEGLEPNIGTSRPFSIFRHDPRRPSRSIQGLPFLNPSSFKALRTASLTFFASSRAETASFRVTSSASPGYRVDIA